MSTSDKITESALRLFYRQGYHATGVEQLSQVAGVTKKTLYRHFPSKEQLIEAALHRRDGEFMARLRQTVDAAAAAQRPLAYIEFIAAWVQEPDFNGCAFVNVAAEYADPADRLHIAAKAHKDAVFAYLEDICAAAGIGQPSLAARQLLLIGEGLIVASQVSGAQEATLEAARRLVSLLTAATAGNPADPDR